MAGLGLLLSLATLSASFGKHIYGGDMSLQATARANYYTLNLNLFFDQANANTSQYEIEIKLYIFRKRDHTSVEAVVVRRTSSQQVEYGNQACANIRNLSVLQMKYSAEVYLDPALYSDPGGYYVVWDRCCRSNDISNIRNAGNTGMLFYMEFPAVRQNGTPFANSSPEFSTPNGAYICVGKPFKLAFTATDADGDQLRYSLVDPLAGYSTAMQPVGGGQSYSSYPAVTWLTDYSATNAIPGKPGLQIDPQTGQLSVTASQIGLFIFAVLCEEYRNGVRIGAVRREFQLPVVDCPRNAPPMPRISYNSKEVVDLPYCEGTSITLSTEYDPQWSYQWQRNGLNISGATSATYTTTEPGNYAVVKSFATTCGGDTISKVTNAHTVPTPDASITASKDKLCEGDSLTLSVKPQTGVSFQWALNSAALSGQTGTALLISKAGMYSVKATESSMGCTGRDSLAIVVNPKPTASLTSSLSMICQDGEVQLTTSSGTGYQYRWSRNNTTLSALSGATVTVRDAGTYQVLITDANNCQASSSPLSLAIAPRPALQFDSLAPVCISQTQTIPLAASPAGGQFTGPGVSGNRFDPATAGPGLHTITYTYLSGPCPSTITRQIQVEAPVDVQLANRVSILSGGTVVLQPSVSKTNVTYQWTPPQSLSDPSGATPKATPDASTTYRLTVTSASGCRTEKSILVDVLQRLFVADVFSPNNDGVNDTWEIRNTDQFPNCEVTIYNRWGEAIFQSKGYDKPWDGMYRNQKVQPGDYLYIIKFNDDLLPDYKGSLMITY